MSRTPLFAALRRAAAMAAHAQKPGAPPLDELVAMPLTRRAALAGALATATLPALAQPRRDLRVAVIGA
ncbi:hypothetical protein, partial [Elioraea rosea]|uniref:hypothetical protein n=1 Tax=Elioraea rosea TaxID=2492390 RepID=UPI0011854DE9